MDRNTIIRVKDKGVLRCAGSALGKEMSMEFLEITIYRIILRTYFYLEETGRKNSFERFPYLRMLTGRLTQETVGKWKQDTGIQAVRFWKIIGELSGRLDAGEAKECSGGRYGNAKDGRFVVKKDEMSGGRKADGVLCTALALCIAAAQVPEYAAYLDYYTGNIVTLQLAFELEGIPYPDFSDVARRLRLLEKICRVDRKKLPQQYAAIEAEDGIFSYLTGADEMNRELVGKAEWFCRAEKLHPMFIRQELAELCAEDISDSVIRIAGKGGRRFLAKQTAQLLGKDLLMVHAGKLKAVFGDEPGELVMQLLREAFLKNGILCIYGITTKLFSEWQITEQEFMELVVQPFCDARICVILCTEAEIYFSGSGGMKVKSVEFAELTREERERVFRGFKELYGLDFDCARYSIRYHLSASEIAGAIERWRNTAVAGEKADGLKSEKGGQDISEEQRFSRICYDILCGRVKRTLGEVIYPRVGFGDLKLSDDMKKTLEQICCSVLEGYRIYEEWNLKEQYPYGRAVTVLLAGPPGTGKTMTAHVLAKELGIPLYQVDLSHILDKYIGETEKHLEQVFQFAEKTNMVLFFDEADSLFGKRGEVTEVKDRYANMEVSYILQRIEQFEGTVVLATNLYNNIDKAFLRRMKYVLKYQFPDAGIRHSIWESCLPPELPRDELDLHYLAEQFDFTGGMIKNVVYAACVLAVYEKRPLDMGHVLRAVKAENEKLERAAGEDVWGAYGYLMD